MKKKNISKNLKKLDEKISEKRIIRPAVYDDQYHMAGRRRKGRRFRIR